MRADPDAGGIRCRIQDERVYLQIGEEWIDVTLATLKLDIGSLGVYHLTLIGDDLDNVDNLPRGEYVITR